MTPSAQASQSALVSGVRIPDSKLASEITGFIRDTESTLLFNHSSRVYYFGALAGKRRGLKFDAELLYAGAMLEQTPRGTSCAGMTSLNRTSTMSGQR